MKWQSMAVKQLDWRQPWSWPRAFQNALFVVVGLLGVLLLSPWWLHGWQAWDEANAAEVIKFFDFAFKEGKKMAEELDYVPMPDVTTDFIRKNVFAKVVTK